MQNACFFGLPSLTACCILMDICEIWIHGNSFSADFEAFTLETYWVHFVIVINVKLNCQMFLPGTVTTSGIQQGGGPIHQPQAAVR